MIDIAHPTDAKVCGKKERIVEKHDILDPYEVVLDKKQVIVVPLFVETLLPVIKIWNKQGLQLELSICRKYPF